YRFISEAYAQWIGRPRGEVIGNTIAEMIGNAGFATLRPHIETVLQGEAVDFECEIDFPRVGRRALAIAYRPERDDDGKVGGWIASLLDVTEERSAEAVTAKRADEQAALYRFTDRLYRAISLSDVYNAALDAIIAALHCSRASVLRLDADGVMRFAAWRGLSDDYRKAVEGHSPWQRGEANPEPVCVADMAGAALDPPIAAAVRREKIGALAFIPLMADGRLAGKFMTYYDAPREFVREDIDLALTIARQLGFAIERMRAEQARLGIEAELRLLSEQLEAEVESRTLERDRIWHVSEDLLAVS